MSIRSINRESVRLNPSMENLLERVDDYSIYCFFIGGEFKITDTLCSPLRVDPRPTFNVFPPKSPRWMGQLMFKDFNGAAGNVFHFVELFMSYHHNVKFQNLTELCNYISNVMQLGTAPIQKVAIKMPDVDDTLKYNIKTMEFKQNHTEYWSDLGVYAQMLEIYCTRAMEYLLDDRCLIIKDFRKTTTFAYIIADRFKIYQPYEENFKKFFNQCPSYYMQGFLQCRQLYNVLVVTKAMKDILVMQSHLDEWVDMVAPHGEGYIIESVWITWMLQYRRVVIIFDPDLTGVKGANRLRKQLKGSPFYTNQEIIVRFVSTTRIMKHGKMEVPVKDSADYRLIYGERPTRKLTKSLIYA